MAQKITFTLSAETVGEATSALLLGSFNNWDYNNAVSLTKQKDGSLKADLELEAGTYEYRYLLNDGRWVNDSKADAYVHSPGFDTENCVITVAEKAAPTKKAAAPVKEEATPVAETPVVKAPAKKAQAPAEKKAVVAEAAKAAAPAPTPAPAKKAAAKKPSKK